MKKSKGHIAFTKDGAYEFYEYKGEVYRANTGNAFDCTSKCRIGRWECSRAQWDKFETMLREQYGI